ncbi:hypothetical protein BaRGS_00005529 [Batillaria attramentaria]|uniref:Apple domain-containing protein n=1 Tax=Batillaria attramentaria TaxID=370345 RepID=A0ABD0LUJ9_9CAEN
MGEAVRQTLFTGSADVDVMFDQCLINSMTVRSELDCARWCSRDPNCETFTFTKGSRTGTCRIHSHVMTSQSPRSSAPGSVAYTVKTEEERCPSGWEKFCASCYWLSTDTKTWDEAKVSPDGKKKSYTKLLDCVYW